MESASRGCAVITSKSGGLSETFYNNIILKKNSSSQLFKEISKLIENKIYLKKIQIENFKNVKHKPFKNINKLDSLRSNDHRINKTPKKNYRIL